MVRCDDPMSRSGVTVGCEGQVRQSGAMVRRDEERVGYDRQV